MPAQYGDISKSITDLFDRSGFGDDKKLKQTFKTPPVMGTAVSVTQETKGLDSMGSSFSTKVSAKWKHACGFAVDKLDFDAKKGMVLETSFSKFSVPGLSVGCNVTKSAYPLSVTYEDSMVACSLKTDAPAFGSVTADLALASEGLAVGTSLTFKGGKASPEDYPISLSYSGLAGVEAACEATDKLKVFTLLGSYKASDDLTLASKFMIPDGGKDKVSMVGIYKLNDGYGSKVAAMYSHASGFGKGDKAKTVEVALVSKPLKGVETGCALAFPLSNVGGFTYGLNFTVG